MRSANKVLPDAPVRAPAEHSSDDATQGEDEMLDRYLGLRAMDAEQEAERRRVAAFEAMHRRPDAEPDPIPVEPAPVEPAQAIPARTRGGLWRVLRRLTGPA